MESIAKLKQKHAQAIAAKDQAITKMQDQVTKQQGWIVQLEDHIKYLQSQRYLRSSEKHLVADNQPSLFDEALDLPVEETVAPEQEVIEGYTRTKTDSKRGRKPLPSYLPRERIEYTLPESALFGPNGEQFIKIGEAISEQLEIIPADLKVIQHVRFKYACPSREELGVKIAPLPLKVIEKGIATPGLLSHVLVSKFCYHLPLYRQEQIWNDLEVNLPRNTLSSWVLACGDKLKPLIELMQADMMLHGHIHVDETPVTVLAEKGKDKKNKPDKLQGPPPPGSKQSYMWVYVGGTLEQRAVIYDYQISRAGVHARNFLDEFKGYVQADAFAGYDKLFALEDKVEVGCWAHARRKFAEILKGHKSKDSKTVYAIKVIGALYAIEADAKERQLSTEQIKLLRQEKALPILTKFKSWLEDLLPGTPPKGMLGKAIGYTLSNFTALMRYCEDGRLCIDNNPAENAIRPFAVGRKNWMFCGNDRGAEAAAVIYSLIETAKLHGLRPFDYLKIVLAEIPYANTPKKLEQLLPYYLKQRQK